MHKPSLLMNRPIHKSMVQTLLMRPQVPQAPSGIAGKSPQRRVSCLAIFRTICFFGQNICTKMPPMSQAKANLIGDVQGNYKVPDGDHHSSCRYWDETHHEREHLRKATGGGGTGADYKRGQKGGESGHTRRANQGIWVKRNGLFEKAVFWGRLVVFCVRTCPRKGCATTG